MFNSRRSNVIVGLAVTSLLLTAGFASTHKLAGQTAVHKNNTAQSINSRRDARLANPVLLSAAIPDNRAYSLLFRIVLTMPGGVRGERAISYLRYIGLGKKCTNCSGVAGEDANDDEIERFIVLAEDYRRALAPVDAAAAALVANPSTRDSGIPSDIRLKLAVLQTEKLLIVDTFMSAMNERLGPSASARVQTFIQKRMKPRIKYVPSR